MIKISLRYQIVLLNLVLTLLYYVFLLVRFSTTNKITIENGILEFIESLFDVYRHIIQYLLINVLWFFIILLGVFKKNKELILGGVYSLVLSVLLLVLLFYS